MSRRKEHKTWISLKKLTFLRSSSLRVGYVKTKKVQDYKIYGRRDEQKRTTSRLDKYDLPASCGPNTLSNTKRMDWISHSTKEKSFLAPNVLILNREGLWKSEGGGGERECRKRGVLEKRGSFLTSCKRRGGRGTRKAKSANAMHR